MPVSLISAIQSEKKTEKKSLHYLDVELWRVGLALHCKLTCALLTCIQPKDTTMATTMDPIYIEKK